MEDLQCNLGGAPVPLGHPSHSKPVFAAAEKKKVSGEMGNGKLKEDSGVVEFGDVGVCHRGVDDLLVGGQRAGSPRVIGGGECWLSTSINF